MADGREPHGLAMLVCDHVYIDPYTGKRSALGIFSTFFANAFPTPLPAFAVYAAITECHGPLALRMQVVDANEEYEPLVHMKGDIPVSDPLAVLELNFAVAGMQIPRPGEYRVQLYAGDHPLIERRLMVIDNATLRHPEPEVEDE